MSSWSCLLTQIFRKCERSCGRLQNVGWLDFRTQKGKHANLQTRGIVLVCEGLFVCLGLAVIVLCCGRTCGFHCIVRFCLDYRATEVGEKSLQIYKLSSKWSLACN